MTQVTRELFGQIREDHRLIAAAVAHNVDDYIGLHRAATSVLVAQPELFRGPGAGRERVRTLFGSFSEVTSLNLYGANGVGLFRSDGGQPVSVAGRPWFEQVRATGEPSLEVDVSQALGRHLFYLARPAYSNVGCLVGIAATALASIHLTELLMGSGLAAEIYLMDETRRLLVHYDGRRAEATDLSATPPVQAFLRDGNSSLAYDAGSDRRLVGCSRAPGLGWA